MAREWHGSCHRCGAKTDAHIMSMFNEELICLECKKKEVEHPQYKAAKEAEAAALRTWHEGGGYNYSGIGKPKDL